MLDDEKGNRWDKWEEKAVTKLIAKFPLGLGIIVLTVVEGFRDLFSKEPPFTSMDLNNPKHNSKEGKE